MRELPQEVDGITQQPDQASMESEIAELPLRTITELHGSHVEVSYKPDQMDMA